jgi:hypothetical protein
MPRRLRILGEHKEHVPNQATILDAENALFVDWKDLKMDGYNRCRELHVFRA